MCSKKNAMPYGKGEKSNALWKRRKAKRRKKTLITLLQEKKGVNFLKSKM